MQDVAWLDDARDADRRRPRNAGRALYLRRCSARERALWQALLLISILLPPLALGLLLSLVYGPTPIGALLLRLGVATSNSPAAFVVTQTYVAMGYYVLGAAAAFAGVPRALEDCARLLGDTPWRAFVRVTFPLASAGLAVSVSLAWVRALGEFGAVAVTAYYPAGMPVQMWTDLQSGGLPTVMPLLVIFGDGASVPMARARGRATSPPCVTVLSTSASSSVVAS